MAYKEVRQDGPALPDGTVFGWTKKQDCVTFCFPIEHGESREPPEPASEAHKLQRALAGAAEPGTPRGWVAVLRFVKQDSVVALGAFEVAFFSPPVDGLPAAELDRLFRAWVDAKAQAPAPDVPPGGLTTRRLRSIRTGDLQTKAREYMRDATYGRALPAGWGAEAHRRPGRAGKAPIHYARLAARYVELSKTSKTPNEDLVLEIPGVNSAKTIRNQLEKARELEFLTRPGKGRIGGDLTQTAKDLLAEHGDTDGND